MADSANTTGARVVSLKPAGDNSPPMLPLQSAETAALSVIIQTLMEQCPTKKKRVKLRRRMEAILRANDPALDDPRLSAACRFLYNCTAGNV